LDDPSRGKTPAHRSSALNAPDAVANFDEVCGRIATRCARAREERRGTYPGKGSAVGGEGALSKVERIHNPRSCDLRSRAFNNRRIAIDAPRVSFHTVSFIVAVIRDSEARFAHARGYVTYADTRLKGRAKIHVPYAV